MRKKFPLAFFLLIAAIIFGQAFASLSLYGYNRTYGLIGIIYTVVFLAALIVFSIVCSKN